MNKEKILEDNKTYIVNFNKQTKEYEIHSKINGKIITISKEKMASKADKILQLVTNCFDEIDNMKWQV